MYSLSSSMYSISTFYAPKEGGERGEEVACRTQQSLIFVARSLLRKKSEELWRYNK